MTIYDKLDLNKYGNEKYTTTTTLTIKQLAYIKKKYKTIKNFINQKITKQELEEFIKEKVKQ